VGITDAIDLTKEQRNMLSELLRQVLPGVAVWAYGSRVKWTARPTSDLDLVAFATPAQRPQVVELKDALAESNLPFPVDLHVWDEVAERFREIIQKEYVVVQEAKQPENRTSKRGEWRNITLGQVTDFLSGGTPSKDAPQYWGGTIPWVSAKDMKRFLLDDTEDHVTEDGAANGTKLVPPDTVLLLARGMTLLNDVPICVVKRSMTFNQDVKALRPKPGVRNEFLPYLLLGNKERLLSLVDLAGHGTGRLNSDELKALDVVLPPEPEQRAIAYILGTLDDKIELNRRMNETLEAMARALFKSWFVDFDPVRAKAEGRNIGLPKSIADLFPDSFEDSELGEIPRGWEVKTLGDLLELAYGKALKAEDRHDGNIPVYGSNGQVGWHDEWLVAGPGIVVGRKGNPGIATWVSTDFFPIDTTFYVVPKSVCPSLEFLSQVLRAQDLASLGADSAVPGLNRNLAYMSRQVLPPLPLLAHFERLASAFSQRVNRANSETRTLVDLRDTLLPKLISGELRMKDAERFMERGCEPTARNPDSYMV
jgi:type I restriction enzyme S subunit